jgi:transposase
MIYPQEIKTEMVNLYTKRGWSIRAIARRYEVSYGGVHRILKAAKVQFRPRGVHGWRPPL